MAKNAYLAIAFVSGICAMVVEIAGGREIASFVGSTIFTWGATIGLVLAALSAGYMNGHRVKKHLSSALFLAGLSTALIPSIVWGLNGLSANWDVIPASLLLSFALVPASFFYGTVSPCIIGILSKKGSEGSTTGKVFAISTSGSLIGVLGTAFLMVPNLGLSQIFALTGVFMAGISIALARGKG